WILSPARLPIPPLSRGHVIDCAGGLVGCQQSPRSGDLGTGGDGFAHGRRNHGAVPIFGRKPAGPLKETRPKDFNIPGIVVRIIYYRHFPVAATIANRGNYRFSDRLTRLRRDSS